MVLGFYGYDIGEVALATIPFERLSKLIHPQVWTLSDQNSIVTKMKLPSKGFR